MGPKTIQDSISSSVANGLLLLPYSLFAPNNNLRPYYIFTLSNEVDRFQSGLTTRKIHIHTKTEDVQKSRMGNIPSFTFNLNVLGGMCRTARYPIFPVRRQQRKGNWRSGTGPQLGDEKNSKSKNLIELCNLLTLIRFGSSISMSLPHATTQDTGTKNNGINPNMFNVI